MTLRLSKQDVIEDLHKLELDWGDEEDAEALVALLLEAFDPVQIYTWLAFVHPELGISPIAALEQGCARWVFSQARKMVSQVSA